MTLKDFRKLQGGEILILKGDNNRMSIWDYSFGQFSKIPNRDQVMLVLGRRRSAETSAHSLSVSFSDEDKTVGMGEITESMVHTIKRLETICMQGHV